MKIEFKQKVSYGLMSLALVLLITTFDIYGGAFYSTQLNLEAFGLILLIAQISDCMICLCYGFFINSIQITNESLNKWLFRFMIFMVFTIFLSVALIFNDPSLNSRVGLLINYCLVIIFYRILTIHYGLLMIRLTADPQERALLGIYRSCFAILAILLATCLLPSYFIYMNADLSQLKSTDLMILFGIIGGICLFLTWVAIRYCKQPHSIQFIIIWTKQSQINTVFFRYYDQVPFTTFGALRPMAQKIKLVPMMNKKVGKVGKVSIVALLRALLQNRNLWLLFMVQFLFWWVAHSVMRMINQFSYLFLQQSNMNTVLLLMSSMLLPSLLSMTFVAPKMYQQLGGKWTSIYSYAGVLLFYLFAYNLTNSATGQGLLYFLLCGASFCLGPALGVNFALIAESIDEGLRLTKIRTTELSYALAVFFGVLGTVIGDQIVSKKIMFMTIQFGIGSAELTSWVKFFYLGQPIMATVAIISLLCFYRSKRTCLS